MPRTGLARLFAASVLAVGLGLAAMIGTATADDVEGADETHTTLLQPGLNAAGWTEPEADVAAIFEALPRLERVYGWDPDAQWFRWAARDASGPRGDLERLTPGMGLWLDIGGIGPAVWTRPLVAPSGLARLRPGWNFVVWAGPDGATVADALSELERDGILVGSAGARRYEPIGAPAPDAAATPRTLVRGSPFWLRVSDAKQWWQLADAPRVEFVGEFSSARQRELRDMVDEAVAWFINRFGLAVPGLTVRFGDAEADMVCGGYAHKTIYLKPDCFSAIVHEYSHALQEHLATTAHKSPAWLVEGVANRWSAQWHDARGDRTYDNHRRVTVIPQAQQTAVSLRSMESRAGLLIEEELGHATYSLAHLAADHLAELAGDDTLFTYWTQRPQSASWESAFEDAFGMSVEEFYSSFEDDRQMIAPSYRLVKGMVVDREGKAVNRVAVLLREQKSWGGIVQRSTTEDSGAFSVRFPQGTYLVSIEFDDQEICIPDLQQFYDSSRFQRISTGILYDATADAAFDSDDVDVLVHLPFIVAENCSQIYGIVRGSNSLPVAGAMIEVTEIPTGSIIYTTETSENGSFTYGIKAGDYKISSTVHSPCYEEQNKEVEISISMDSDPSERTIDFYIPAAKPCPLAEGITIGPNLQPLSKILIRTFGSNFGGVYSAMSGSDGTFIVIPSFYLPYPFFRIQFSANSCLLGWYDSDNGRMSDEQPNALIRASEDGATSIVVHVESTSCDLSGHSGNTRLFVPDYRPAP